jgi:hypothetical protein
LLFVALGALHAQLVAAARARLEPDERRGEISLRVPDHLEMRLGRNIAHGGGPDQPAFFVNRQQVAPDFLLGVGMAKDQGVVSLAYLFLGEVFADHDGELLARGGKDHAGGGGIEAVQEPEMTLRTFLVAPGKALRLLIVTAGQQRTRLVLGGVGMREDAGRLVEGNQSVGVLGQQGHLRAQRHRLPEISRLCTDAHW